MSSVTLVWPSSTHWLGISTASPPWTEDVISVPYISGGILAFAPVAASFSLPSSRKRVRGQHRCPPFAISYFLNSQEELACSTWPVLPWWNKIHLSDKILRVNKPDVKGGATPSKKNPDRSVYQELSIFLPRIWATANRYNSWLRRKSSSWQLNHVFTCVPGASREVLWELSKASHSVNCHWRALAFLCHLDETQVLFKTWAKRIA